MGPGKILVWKSDRGRSKVWGTIKGSRKIPEKRIKKILTEPVDKNIKDESEKTKKVNEETRESKWTKMEQTEIHSFFL